MPFCERKRYSQHVPFCERKGYSQHVPLKRALEKEINGSSQVLEPFARVHAELPYDNLIGSQQYLLAI